MKRFTAQMKKSTDDIRLKASERRELREQLVSYMEYHPLPKDMRTPARRTTRADRTAVAAAGETDAFTHVRVPWLALKGVAGFAAVVLIVGVPYFAEQAVPGDALYPFKVQVNEEVRGSLAFSDYDEIEWETERLGRRIDEARLLANEGRLTPEIEAEVARAVRDHSGAAQDAIRSLRLQDTEGATIAEIQLASTLDVQSAILRSHNVATTTTGRSTDAIAVAVAEAQQAAQNNKSTTTIPYERLSSRVEQETTRAEELFKSISEYAAQPQVDEIERRFDDIERKFARAVDVHEERPELATTLLREILADVQKMVVFMTDIDVQENVSIDTLIPEELTDDERRIIITEQVAEIKAVRTAVADELTNLDAETQEKAQAAFIMINSLLEQVREAESAGDLLQAEQRAREARAFADDLAQMADTDLSEETDPASDDTTASSTDETASTSPQQTDDDGSAGDGSGATSSPATTTPATATSSAPATSTDTTGTTSTTTSS